LLPRLQGLFTGPGTTRTSMPRSIAASAVMRLPPAACDSTTTTTCDSAAMMRLRAGNLHAWAGCPGGVSEMTAPAPATRSHSALWRVG